MEKTETNDIAEIKKKNTMIFINVVQVMLEQEKLEKISVRKIAEKAGFHNSTIYLYFEDIDQLIMLASMKYFQEYSYRLELQSQKDRTAEEDFFSIWGLFFDTILKKQYLFYNFFFGKHSSDLEKIMKLYYDIFPEERRQFSADIETMYFGKNISERSLSLLNALISGQNHVIADNLNMLNEIIVSFCKYKLEQKCQNPQMDSEQIKEEFLRAMAHVIGVE